MLNYQRVNHPFFHLPSAEARVAGRQPSQLSDLRAQRQGIQGLLVDAPWCHGGWKTYEKHIQNIGNTWKIRKLSGTYIQT